MAAFTEALSQASGQPFADAQALHAWTVAHYREFWRFFLGWTGTPLAITGSEEPVCEGESCEHARFFPNLRLNYAHSLLNAVAAGDDAPALRACHADGRTECWTRGELREQVARLAAVLAREGLGEGDRVVALMRNDGHAVIAALAVTALGATLSTASPDMGVDAVLERFAPLSPRLFMAHCAARSFDTGMALGGKVDALMRGLPGLQCLLQLDTAADAPPGAPATAGAAPRVLRIADCLADDAAARAPWPSFEFNHPLFIMFSSGTTGRPKCIVHGAGGTLLEHAKEHRLHTDLRPGDRMYFHTSCGWMMWNWQLSALASGAEIVTYDGPIASVDTLWRLAAQQGVTVFGTSPAYLRMSEQAGLAPGTQFDLRRLRAVLSTGAVLQDAQYHWVREKVKPVPLQSISGGTDIVGCFVLGHPDLPVSAGEAQCRSLGLDVQAWQDGQAVQGAVGELVCANPFPSRPLGFFGDVDGSRFHAAYFAQNPGVWTHGDLVEFSASGGARLHGRSDGVLNVRGIKFAPGEIYKVLDGIEGVREAMVVEQRVGEADARIVALLVMAAGVALDAAMARRLRREIAQRLSSAHVPDRFVVVPALPVTHSGKASESAARSAVNARRVENTGALRNPECLDAIRRAVAIESAGEGDGAGAGEPADLQRRLQVLWQDLLGVPGIGPDDNFFELGGNSLLAARLLGQVSRWTGRTLPIGLLVQAPTIGQLLDVIEGGTLAPASSLVVRMREGTGRPVFLVHGLSGTIMECWRLAGALQTPRPVWGLQARGLDGEETAPESIDDMARLHIEQMRSVQPTGPYALCGFSFGGLLAVEIARQLHAAGERLELVCLLDPHLRQGRPWPARIGSRGLRMVRRVAGMPAREARQYLRRTLAHWLQALRRPAGTAARPSPGEALGMDSAQQRVYERLLVSLAGYRPRPFDGTPFVYVRAQVGIEGYFDPMPVWRRALGDCLQLFELPGAHLDLVGPHAARVAALMDERLEP